MTLFALVVSTNACVIVVDAERQQPADREELLFGPDEHCPGECVNPADETCYHLPGGCGRGDGVIDDDDSENECDPCAG